MKRGPWKAIGIGTAVAAIGLWSGLLAMRSDAAMGVILVTLGMVFSMYVLALFSTEHDPATLGFKSALSALAAAGLLLFWVALTGSELAAAAAPVVGLGVGAAVGLYPQGNKIRFLIRVAGVAAMTGIIVFVYWVDHGVYALVAPFGPLAAAGMADRVFDSSIDVLAETPD